MIDLNTIKWNADGLAPAIVQDAASGRVLMQAWMNRQSLEITMAEGQTCFFSRSRQQLWRKGETSGNVQRVVSIYTDCDRDCLLLGVIPMGPACHTGAESCFYEEIQAGEGTAFSLGGLHQTILGRKKNRPAGAYTTYLFDQGLDKILKKVGEECAEVIIAAKNPESDQLVYELADLCYHSMVLMAQRGVAPSQILAELASRQRPEAVK